MSKPVVVLLVNLGSPERPNAEAVAGFLRPFLSDRRVVEIPRWVWWPILNGIVIPRRAKRVAKKYESIWMEQGSPIRVFTERLAEGVQQHFSGTSSAGAESNAGAESSAEPGSSAATTHRAGIKVRHAMAYGSPAISDVLAEEQQAGVEQFVVVPLYPQYSATTTAAVYDQIARYTLAARDIPDIRVIKYYYDQPDYIQALAASVRARWTQEGRPQRLLMSFHGIPQRNVELGDPYHQHCLRTAELLADELGLEPSDWGLAFQSRFGKAQWLKPYTDQLITEWAKEGVKSLSVISPAFAVDCLETLEEISQEYRDLFFQQGGESFDYIPCLNDSAMHVKMLANLTAHYL